MTHYIIAGEDTGEMYEWAVTDVWYDEATEKFFIYESAGCSCNYAYDEVGYGEPIPLSILDGPFTFHEVLKKVSTDLKAKVLAWDLKGRPAQTDVDRW